MGGDLKKYCTWVGNAAMRRNQMWINQGSTIFFSIHFYFNIPVWRSLEVLFESPSAHSEGR